MGTTTFEVARALAQARSFSLCEGCRLPGSLDPHHRMTRGMGGVHGVSADVANDVRNLLMLCRPCHDRTLAAETVPQCIAEGWVIERRSGVWPQQVPAKIHTVNGYGWWYLTEDGGYQWADDLNLQPDFRLTYKIENEER